MGNKSSFEISKALKKNGIVQPQITSNENTDLFNTHIYSEAISLKQSMALCF